MFFYIFRFFFLYLFFFFFFFFFSSRRRHTRFDCDWSSDVCSSDLHVLLREAAVVERGLYRRGVLPVPRLAQVAEVAERVHLRALLAGLRAGVVRLHVEEVRAARDRIARLGLHRVLPGEGRKRHGVRAHLRELVGLGTRLLHVPGAAL